MDKLRYTKLRHTKILQIDLSKLFIRRVISVMSWIDMISDIKTIDFRDHPDFDIKIVCRDWKMTFPRLYIPKESVFGAALTQDSQLILDEEPQVVNLCLNWLCRDKNKRVMYLKRLLSSDLIKLAYLGFKYLPEMQKECFFSISEDIHISKDMPLLIQAYLDTKMNLKDLVRQWSGDIRSVKVEYLKKYPQVFWQECINIKEYTCDVLRYCDNIPHEYIEAYSITLTTNLERLRNIVTINNANVDKLLRAFAVSLLKKEKLL